MATLTTQGISLYYELLGNPANPPVLLIAGLGGVGTSWGPQIERFAAKYHVIVPDQRGTGRTTRAADGYTTEQIAADMAALVRHLGRGPVHVVGESTGGAIGQYMALNHPDTVRSLIMSSTFARFDAYAQRQFEVRRKVLAESDRETVYNLYALFLFSPGYTRKHPGKVQAWIDRVVAQPVGPQDLEIALKRTDMIMAHDTLAELGAIRQPTLILCGDHDFCTPPQLSDEIADAVPGAELVVLQDGGHLIELEQEDEYFQVVSSFVDRQDG
jgi:aminoacrylate hydrolase